jgi:O-acetyl-ADP-ribose deacetylase (regulator of RNase III)
MIDSLWLIHPDEEPCEAFRKRFEGLPNVRVVRARFEDLEPHDCFVTAANAFGMMTAGIDAVIVERFGEGFMRRVQDYIMDRYLGEQPLGTAVILDTGDEWLPFVCHAPTMRVPSSIDGSDKVYNATWAALLSVYHHNQAAARKIGTVAMPAMGCGFGNVPYLESARQMAAAYRHFLNPPHRIDWDWVIDRHRSISYDGKRQAAST